MKHRVWWLTAFTAVAAGALGLLAYGWVTGVKRHEPPPAAVAAANVFFRARLVKDCATAWSWLSDRQRMTNDEQQFCEHLGAGCTKTDVEVTSSSAETGALVLTGRMRCDMRLWVPFVVTMAKTADRWQVDEFTDGH